MREEASLIPLLFAFLFCGGIGWGGIAGGDSSPTALSLDIVRQQEKIRKLIVLYVQILSGLRSFDVSF